MRVEGLNITLRRRPSWEAVDLGVALVRRHARPIALSWFAASGVAFVLLNALLLPFDLAWLAALLLWWLKPVFDRIPLHVLSRAILGEEPGVRETLRAQWRGHWRPILPWLLWRRLHPARSMLLAVDMLEGLRGSARSERVRVLSRGEGSTPLLLWVIGLHLELMLWGSIIAFGLMLVPSEFLSDSAKALFDTMMERPPWWMHLLNNGLYWLVMAVIEPIYVGAGFALYLNRRTHLEAWDIELAFRRMAARIARTAAAALLTLTLLLPASELVAQTPAGQTQADQIKPLASRASDDAGGDGKAWRDSNPQDCAQRCKPLADDADTIAAANHADTNASTDWSAPLPLSELFADARVGDGAGFARAVEQAMADPDLSPTEQVGRWRWRGEDDEADAADTTPAWLNSLAGVIALAIENILWLALAIALLLLLLNHRRWLPWLSARRSALTPSLPSPLEEQALPVPLPADLDAAVLAHWRAGERRAALSLFYRASLVVLVERVGSPLPPGATESDCLRHARRLAGQPFAIAFRRVVICWQAAAYAHRLPSEAELLELLSSWRHAGQPA